MLNALGTQIIVLEVIIDLIDIQLGVLVLGLLDQLHESVQELLLLNFPLLGLSLLALCALLFRFLLRFRHLDSFLLFSMS